MEPSLALSRWAYRGRARRGRGRDARDGTGQEGEGWARAGGGRQGSSRREGRGVGKAKERKGESGVREAKNVGRSRAGGETTGGPNTSRLAFTQVVALRGSDGSLLAALSDMEPREELTAELDLASPPKAREKGEGLQETSPPKTEECGRGSLDPPTEAQVADSFPVVPPLASNLLSSEGYVSDSGETESQERESNVLASDEIFASGGGSASQCSRRSKASMPSFIAQD